MNNALILAFVISLLFVSSHGWRDEGWQDEDEGWKDKGWGDDREDTWLDREGSDCEEPFIDQNVISTAYHEGYEYLFVEVEIFNYGSEPLSHVTLITDGYRLYDIFGMEATGTSDDRVIELGLTHGKVIKPNQSHLFTYIAITDTPHELPVYVEDYSCHSSPSNHEAHHKNDYDWFNEIDGYYGDHKDHDYKYHQQNNDHDEHRHHQHFEDDGFWDDGLEDSSFEDSGVEDSGVEDSGVEDSGIEDSGVEDSGVEDSQVEDSQVEDSGVEDSGVETSTEDELPTK